MDMDEILRLKQITGLAELFREQDFSRAWEPRSVNEKKRKASEYIHRIDKSK